MDILNRPFRSTRRLSLLVLLGLGIGGCSNDGMWELPNDSYQYGPYAGFYDPFFYDPWYGGYPGGGTVIVTPPPRPPRPGPGPGPRPTPTPLPGRLR